MATVGAVSKTPAKGLHTVTWTITNGDTGVACNDPMFADRSVHIYGTPGAGFALAIEGSNDGTNYVALTDTAGNVLTFSALSAAVLKQILQNAVFIRPRCSGGDGTTSVTVILLGRSTRA